MIAEKLQKSILQAAIQGKLTEQLPEDGDVRDLLEEIKAEKARLMKEGKIKKETPLPEITEDEIPFDIPDGWTWIRLGEVITVRGGKRLPEGKKLTQTKTNHIYIRVTDMKNGSIDSSDLHYITDDVCEKIKDYIITSDDLYIVIVGSTIGKVGLVPEVFNNMNLTENAARLTPYRVNKKYLLNLLMSKLLQEQFFEKTKQVGQPKLALARLKSSIIPLPSIAEQQRIVDKIEELMSKISLLEKDELKLNLLQKSFPKKMKDSLLQAAIQGKLTEQLESDGDAQALVADIQKEKERLIKEGKIKKEKALPEITEEEIPFDIPENWCWVRLGDIISLQTGASFKKEQSQEIKTGNVRILRGGNIEDSGYKFFDNDIFLDPNIVKKDILLRKDDLITPSVTSLENVGKIVHIDQDFSDVACGGFVFLIRILEGYQNLSMHVLFCIKSPLVRKKMKELTNKSGQAFYNLGAEKFKNMVIPFPPFAEQQRIIERLEEILPFCDTLE